MIFLIGQLALYLIVAFLFAAFAGWSFAAQRAAPDEAKRRRDREALLRDIERLTSGGGVGGDPLQAERADEAARGLLSIRDARIAELEGALERARARADETEAELAEWQRRERAAETDAGELTRLRALVAAHDEERANEVEAEVEEVGPTETEILQSWRLRYFEQRVRYLEGLSQAPMAPATRNAEPSVEWRLREAEARAAHLANEVRALSARAPAEEPRALAADADADMLLRWRMLYLERRAAYLQEQLAHAETAPALVAVPATDPDLWKWRARYLEARVRHLEARPAPVTSAPAPVEVAPLAAVDAPPPPAPAPTVAAQKPAILAAARNGAPDDFTLIETISPMQQTMLNAIGVFHFDQIAAWTEANVAWVDRYFRLRGRVAEEEWVEQAADLAREGVRASRRMLASEEV